MKARPALQVASRSGRARAALVGHEVSALIATAPSSVRWLTGFTGSAGLVVLTESDLVLVTDGRYAEQAPDELTSSGSDASVQISSHGQGEIVAGIIGDAEPVALEADHVAWATAETIRKDWLSDAVPIVPTQGLIAGLRSVKDEYEVARISEAAAVTDAALASVAERLVPGVTELEFGAALDAAIRVGGAEDVAFETIVASGPNASRPHHRPSSRAFEDGDLVIIDVGAQVDGYRSDMTRTLAIGDPGDELTAVYELVIRAQQAGVEAVAAGSPTRTIDEACRSIITDAGRGSEFVHGTGHGVGLDIHELPRIGARTDDVVAIGNVITVEPGVYLPNVGGVRIEDTVHVGADGTATRLTLAPKSLAPAVLAG